MTARIAYDGYYETYKGYRVLAIDGSKIALPDIHLLGSIYGTMGADSSSPTAQASICYDVLNKVIVDAMLEPLTTDEKTLSLGAIVRHMDNTPETVRIFATYDDEMEKLFKLNQGLKSRISNIILFEGYNTEQLTAIFKLMANCKGYTVARGFRKVIAPYFDKMKMTKSFGNGRDARKLLEATIGIMAVQNKSFSTTISLSAIRRAVKESLENQTAKMNRIGFYQ